MDTPLPLVRVGLGTEEAEALVDTGCSTDLGWYGAIPAGCVAPDAPEQITMWAMEASGHVERRSLTTLVRLGGQSFEGLHMDTPPRRPDQSLPFSAIIGFGILRRQPVVLDFEHHALWLWVAHP